MTEQVVGYKLLLVYDVDQEKMDEYYQFVMRQLVPTLQNQGLQMIEAWHTAYGDAPNRLIAFVCPDKQPIQDLLSSSDWLDLNHQLAAFVTDYEFKVVPYRGGFQI